jgi:hypothetical protein
MKDPEDESRIPPALLTVFWGIIAITLNPCFWPLIPLLGYPTLLVIALVFLADWFVVRGRGLLSRRLAQLVSFWVICLGLVLIMQGVMICMDTALKGAPPTPEEKRLGKMIAYVGTGLAGLAAIGAYAFQPWQGSRRKQEIQEFEELPAGPGG